MGGDGEVGVSGGSPQSYKGFHLFLVVVLHGMTMRLLARVMR
jgi:hypothetical protein